MTTSSFPLRRSVLFLAAAVLLLTVTGCPPKATERGDTAFIDRYLELGSARPRFANSPADSSASILDQDVETRPDKIGEIFLPDGYFNDKTLNNKLRIASNFLFKGQYASARDQLLEFLRSREEDPIASFLLALAFLGLGDSGREELMLRRTVSLDPKHAIAYYNLGCLYLARGEEYLALSSFDNCIAVEPGFVPAVYNKALIAMRWNLYDSAVALLRGVLTAEPANTDAMINLGVACEKTGRSAQAVAWYLQANSAAPDRPEPLANLSALALSAGQLDDALEYATRWMALEPSSECNYRLAGVFSMRGDMAMSRKYLLDAMDIVRTDPVAVLADPALQPLFTQMPDLVQRVKELR